MKSNATVLIGCVTLSFLGMRAAKALANETVPQESKVQETESIPGEGKTLPASVYRVRIPYKFASATKGFSSNGRSEDAGFQFNANAAALVVEYGLRDAISLQFVAPYVLKNNMSMNGSVFQKSSFFEEKQMEFLKAASEKLVAEKLCRSVDACIEAINTQGLSLPVSTNLTLPTGETLSVKAGVPLKDIAASLVTRAAIPTAGRTGLGDIEVGALFALFDPRVGLLSKNKPINFSLGLGLRLPTGSFEDVPAAQRSTGRGTLDLGIRTNFDWQPLPGLMLSQQNQFELMLKEGRKKRSSLIESAQLNSADPLVTGADQIANTSSYTRDGTRNVGFLKLALGLGQFSQDLKPVLLNAQWKYDFEPATKFGGKKLNAESSLQAVQVGTTLDGLPLQVPLQCDVDYEIPMSGSNRALAPRVLSATLKLFYKH